MFSKMFLSILLAFGGAAIAKPSKPIAKALQSSVQVIIPNEALGSGVIVANYKTGVLVATNDHVCQNTRGRKVLTSGYNFDQPINSLPITIKTVDGQIYKAVVLRTTDLANPKRLKSKTSDLCLLYVANSGLQPITLSSDELEVGDEVFTVSGPSNVFPSITTGYAGNTYIDEEMLDIRSCTAGANHGSSGGGVFNEKGELVGILFSILLDSENKSPVATYFVQQKHLKEFISKATKNAE